jgi:hypothetical protein
MATSVALAGSGVNVGGAVWADFAYLLCQCWLFRDSVDVNKCDGIVNTGAMEMFDGRGIAIASTATGCRC